MNDIEERLKDAYFAATDTVSPGDIRQLDEQSFLITWPGTKRPRPVRRWAIPVATFAMVAVIAATALPRFLTSAGGRTGGSPSGDRFLSALTPNSRQIIVINAATGTKVASVAPPASNETFRTAATGDGITYVTAVTRPGACGARLFQFRLDSAGKPGPLTPFDGGRQLQDVSMLAMSANGHSFAYLVHTCPVEKRRNGYVYFVNFKTGLHRQWRVGTYGTINGLSLTADGSKLAVGVNLVAGLRSGILLKDTSDRSGIIDDPDRTLVTADELGHHHGFAVSLPTITPDGRTVFLVSIGPGHVNPGEQIRSVAAVIKWPRSALKVVARVTGMTSLAADPSVSRAIGIHQAGIPKPKAFIIDLRTGRITYMKSSFYVPAGGQYIW